MAKHFYAVGRRIRKIYLYGAKYYIDDRYRRTIDNRLQTARDKIKYGKAFINNKKEFKGKLVQKHGKFCNWCGKRFPVRLLTIDHIVPVSVGGGKGLDNMQLLCRPCHNKKDNYKPRSSYVKQVNTQFKYEFERIGLIPKDSE